MNKVQLTVIVLVVIIGGIGAGKMLFAPKKAPAVETSIQDPRAKGNPQARVKIVEYVDFQCPACAYGLTFLKTFLLNIPMIFI